MCKYVNNDHTGFTDSVERAIIQRNLLLIAEAAEERLNEIKEWGLIAEVENAGGERSVKTVKINPEEFRKITERAKELRENLNFERRGEG
jgi:hypothetical protein